MPVALDEKFYFTYLNLLVLAHKHKGVRKPKYIIKKKKTISMFLNTVIAGFCLQFMSIVKMHTFFKDLVIYLRGRIADRER